MNGTFPWKSVFRGFLLAPLPVWGILAVLGFLGDLVVMTWPEAIVHELFVLVYEVIGSYFLLILIALPLLAIGWRFFRVSLPAVLLLGATVGGALMWFPFALQYYGRAPMWDFESLGGTPLIIAHRFTQAGLVHYFRGGAQTACVGAVIGALFWWIAVRGKPASQKRGGLA